ncbi:hypothetical protein ACFQMA_20525 [Halosimplex aquaticum]|uniref:Queuine tRNA-ribosyltransferase n=1 Tax=Halosimplex aquaticum TaxID=3026162 RepID=A0ABD5YA14_9EURY|nr:hypothetical protein [Halosimplex aquaticum]
MYGILTADADLAREGLGDRTYYFAERVSGTRRDPVPGVVNSVACWGDTEAVRESPDRAAVAGDGTPAAPDVEGHHWGTVCPTDPDYRAALLDRIADVGAVGDVRLTTPGFPGEDFCRCDRCERLFGESDFDERVEWRSTVITEFVADAADRADGDVIATLYPDPYPGHLQERAGLDPAALAEHVDGFLVPLCGTGYETTYWVESLARGFASAVGDLDASLSFQLSTSGTEAERLAGLARQIREFGDGVVFGIHRTDADLIRDVFAELNGPESSVVA